MAEGKQRSGCLSHYKAVAVRVGVCVLAGWRKGALNPWNSPRPSSSMFIKVAT